MNDKTMPPNDPTEASPAPMSGPDMGAQPQGGGDVQVSMPKQEFDGLHQMITQIASVLDQLKQSVEQQAGGSSAGGPPAGGPPAGPMGGGSPEGGSDDDFLKGLVAEGNARR